MVKSDYCKDGAYSEVSPTRFFLEFNPNALRNGVDSVVKVQTESTSVRLTYGLSQAPVWVVQFAYARIMMSSILNLLTAFKACGRFAGSVMVSPVRTLNCSLAI